MELPTESEPVKVICGDALDVLRELPTGSIDSLITDPPYCSGAATEAGRGSATHQGLRSETIRTGRFEWFDADNMTTSGLMWLLRSMCVEASRVVANSGSVLSFCDWRMVTVLSPAMESGGFRLRNLIAWDKGHFGCGSGFRPQHEMILHLTKRAPEFYAMDVGNVIRSKRVRTADRDHPTEKPIDLLQQLIRVACPPGGVVLDCFGGSGATAIAALHEGRRCLIIEKDAGYCDIIRRRVADAQGVGKGSLLVEQPDLFADCA
jgi:site-specific DNA-methyltransferase (adenine-specific)